MQYKSVKLHYNPIKLLAKARGKVYHDDLADGERVHADGAGRRGAHGREEGRQRLHYYCIIMHFCCIIMHLTFMSSDRLQCRQGNYPS